MIVKRVVELPVGSSGCERARVFSSDLDVIVDVLFLRQSKLCGTVVVFNDVIAYRFNDELHSGSFPPEAFDCVVEVLESAWLRELAVREPKATYLGVSGKRHFAAFFSNVGYLEVVADSVRSEPSGYSSGAEPSWGEHLS